jgi:hypothetical protein
MDRMLVQRWVTMEQEFERRHAEYIETCRADFRSKTDTALARYKQVRDTLERKVRDLEAELKGRTRCAEAPSAPWPKPTPGSARSKET